MIKIEQDNQMLENINVSKFYADNVLSMYELKANEGYILYDTINGSYFEIFGCPATYDLTLIKAVIYEDKMKLIN